MGSGKNQHISRFLVEVRQDATYTAAKARVKRETKPLVKMKIMAETIQSNSGKILEAVRTMTTCLERQVDALRESVTALKRN